MVLTRTNRCFHFVEFDIIAWTNLVRNLGNEGPSHSTIWKEFPNWIENWNNVFFTRQRIRWKKDPQSGTIIKVRRQSYWVRNQTSFCTLTIHARYRSVLGQINWLQREHSFSVATHSPDLLQWQVLQQLLMWRHSIRWRTIQVTTGEPSILANYKTMKKYLIFLMFLPKQRRCHFAQRHYIICGRIERALVIKEWRWEFGWM